MIPFPTGVILPYGGASSPSGWFLCDGSAISRTLYASLFASIGVVWGYGDNSTTFNLPDMRGRFPRGRDAGIARDPDRASRTAANTGGATGDNVGSVQAEATKKNGLINTAEAAHTHTKSGSVGAGSSHTHANTIAYGVGSSHSHGQYQFAHRHYVQPVATGNDSPDHFHAIQAYEWILPNTATGAGILMYSRNSNANNGIQDLGTRPGANTRHTHNTMATWTSSAGDGSGNTYNDQLAAYWSTGGTAQGTTTAEAAHTHTKSGSVSAEAAHTHSDTIAYGPGSSHNHTISGDNETRPLNANVNYIIKI